MVELTVAAKKEALAEVQAFVEESLEQTQCPLKAQMQIDIAVEEIFVNIVNYAYPKKKGKATVRLFEEPQPKGVTLQFIDSGIPYNPLAREDPNTAMSAEERNIGGLGIFMVKKTMDALQYVYENGCNIFTITKYF